MDASSSINKPWQIDRNIKNNMSKCGYCKKKCATLPHESDEYEDWRYCTYFCKRRGDGLIEKKPGTCAFCMFDMFPGVGGFVRKLGVEGEVMMLKFCSLACQLRNPVSDGESLVYARVQKRKAEQQTSSKRQKV
jgi:hypothetical protein